MISIKRMTPVTKNHDQRPEMICRPEENITQGLKKDDRQSFEDSPFPGSRFSY